MKKIITVLLVLVTILSMSGCSRRSYGYGDRTFNGYGMTITLTNAFSSRKTEESRGYIMTFESKDSFVLVQKEMFALVESGPAISDKEYAQRWIDANKNEREFDKIEAFGGFVATKYSSTVEGINYVYFVAIYKGRDAFWTVQFSCHESLYEELRPYFIRWASSVRFS